MLIYIIKEILEYFFYKPGHLYYPQQDKEESKQKDKRQEAVPGTSGSTPKG